METKGGVVYIRYGHEANTAYFDCASLYKDSYNNGFSYGFTYDKYGNVTKTSVGSQGLAANKYQSKNGNLEKVTYGNGDYNEYTYDSYGNILTVKKNGATKYKWTYNNGIMSGHLDSVNKLKYTYLYDMAGRIVRQGAVSTTSIAKITPYLYNTQ